MIKYNSREIFGEKAQLEAVKQDGYAIRYIHNPSEAVQLEAVKQDGNAIQYIEDPSEAVQLEAVKQDGNAIRYIHNPSEAVMQVALDQDENSIQFFKQSWNFSPHIINGTLFNGSFGFGPFNGDFNRMSLNLDNFISNY